MSADDLPTYAWNTTNPFSDYAAGGSLKDASCGQMARYFARLVGWYTAGGFHDECGHWHASGFNYTWWGVSVLNEDEHHIAPDDGEVPQPSTRFFLNSRPNPNPNLTLILILVEPEPVPISLRRRQAYTQCFDAIKTEVSKVNPKTVLVGPEIAGNLNYLLYFLNGTNHADGEAPPIASYHQAMSFGNASAESGFRQWDGILSGYVQPVEAFKRKTGQKTEMVLNECVASPLSPVYTTDPLYYNSDQQVAD